MTQYTPGLNLPYPEESDPPRGWEQIQALAEAIEAQISPPTWYDLPLQSGFTATSAATPPMYTWHAGQVFLQGAVSPSSGNFPTAAVSVAGLPIGYRPRQVVRMDGSGAVIGTPLRLQITTGGTVQVTAATTNNSYVYLDNLRFFVPEGAAKPAPPELT